jgi:hypothetical protein
LLISQTETISSDESRLREDVAFPRSFTTLGDDVARAWEAAEYRVEAFSGIATSMLANSGVLESTSLRDITAWLMSSKELPTQQLGDFGQPPVRIYRGRGFYIELLFWVDIPTAIHQHSFSGAFGVLRGSSFHSQYRFDVAHRIGEQIQTGSLTLLSVELLGRGDVRPILVGDSFIHSLLHLEPPSISVVVRTGVSGPFGPQMTYQVPGLAIDPFYKEEPLPTQLALMSALLRSEPDLFRETALDIVAGRDYLFAYKIIEAVSRISGECDVLDELLQCLKRRNAEFAAIVAAALCEERRVSSLSRHLKNVPDAANRILLALLMNAPDRDVVDLILRARFPERDPEATILESMRQLASGSKPVFDFDKVSLLLLKFAMRGASFDSVSKAFVTKFGDAGYAIQDALCERWTRIHDMAALKALLPNAGARFSG